MTCAPSSPPSSPRRVLIVDDEEFYRKALCGMFETIQVEADHVGSGQDAIERIRRGDAYDLVVLDIVMPGMNGIETLRQVKATRPEQPVLLSSGLLTVDILRFAAQMGVATIKKPFTILELKERVRPLLD